MNLRLGAKNKSMIIIADKDVTKIISGKIYI